MAVEKKLKIICFLFKQMTFHLTCGDDNTKRICSDQQVSIHKQREISISDRIEKSPKSGS